MRLLHVHLARSIWLGDIRDFNPQGKSLYRVIWPFLTETYKFRKFPSLTESSDLTKGISFQDGEFQISQDELPIAVNLTIYNDGVLADSSSSSEYSDMFLADVFHHFSEIFKMPPFQSVIRRRIYLSQLTVSTDKTLEVLNPKLKQLSKYLSAHVELDKVFQLGGIHIWPDQVSRVNPSPFIFERAINVPFSENKYFSTAPLQTKQHLELLDKLETVLG